MTGCLFGGNRKGSWGPITLGRSREVQGQPCKSLGLAFVPETPAAGRGRWSSGGWQELPSWWTEVSSEGSWASRKPERVLRAFELGPSGLQGEREGFISPWGHVQALLSQRLWLRFLLQSWNCFACWVRLRNLIGLRGYRRA